MIEKEERLKGGTEMDWFKILSDISEWIAIICVLAANLFMSFSSHATATVFFSVATVGFLLSTYLKRKE